jgi:clan AA aspartic protease
MIRGSVSPAAVPSIDLTLQGPGGQITVGICVDTGLDGELLLPTPIIQSLRLQHTGTRAANLADGTPLILNRYAVNVHWDGQVRQTNVLETAGDPLLGMTLMHGNRLTIDVVPGGEVLLEELP